MAWKLPACPRGEQRRAQLWLQVRFQRFWTDPTGVFRVPIGVESFLIHTGLKTGGNSRSLLRQWEQHFGHVVKASWLHVTNWIQLEGCDPTSLCSGWQRVGQYIFWKTKNSQAGLFGVLDQTASIPMFGSPGTGRNLAHCGSVREGYTVYVCIRHHSGHPRISRTGSG